MINIKEYLYQHYAPTTSARYLRDIAQYLIAQPHAKTAGYPEIINYLGTLRNKYSNPGTIHRILQAIKKYYHYLCYTRQREDHPCRYLILKDHKKKPLQLQDLFTEKQLEQLMEAPGRKCTLLRNKIIVSLFIYQGLTRTEISQVEREDIKLTSATIFIKGSTITNSRELPLKGKQVSLLYEYLIQERPLLMKGHKITHLFISHQGKPLQADALTRLLQSYQYLFPGKSLTPRNIRMSVISNLLKQGKDLRIVQHYIGHKNPGSTERYKQQQEEELRAAILRHHPLN